MNQGAQPTQAIEPPMVTEGTPAGAFSTPPGNTDREQHIEECHHMFPPDADHTCPHPYHLPFSETNLPPLLFRLEQPEATTFLTPDVPLLSEHGLPIPDHEGFYIRDFWYLPRYISKIPPAWLLEFWMRSDPRLTFTDIKARMTVPRNELPSDQVLMDLRENGVCRPLGLSCWFKYGRGSTSRAELEWTTRLSFDQISFNTTMAVEYSRTSTSAPTWLVDRSFDLSTAKRFELSTFLDGGQCRVPAARIQKHIFELFYAEPSAGTNDDRRRTYNNESSGSYTIHLQQSGIFGELSFGGGNMQSPHNTEYISVDHPYFDYIFPERQPGQDITRPTQSGLKRKRLSEEPASQNSPDGTAQGSPIGSQSSEVPATQTQSDTTTQAFWELRRLPGNSQPRLLAPKTPGRPNVDQKL